MENYVNHRLIMIFLSILIFLLSNCSKNDVQPDFNLEIEVPNCIETLIAKSVKENSSITYEKVWMWKSKDDNNKVYYHFIEECCDKYNFLYDGNCNLICAPDGGFTGGGDGNCQFDIDQFDYILIWQRNK